MNLSNMLKAKSKQNKKENETCQQSCWRDQGELIHKKKKKKKKCQITAIWQKTRKQPNKFILMPYETVLKYGFQVDTKKRSYHIM